MIASIVKNVTKYLLVFGACIFFAFNSYALEQDNFAPDFTLKSNTGESIRLSDLRGQVVMINFWATWCGPCRQQLGITEKLHKIYGVDSFTVLSINVDSDPKGTKGIINGFGVTYPVLFDEDNKVSKSYQVNAMPSTYFINKAGKLGNMQRGFSMGDEKRHEKIIRGLLKE